jgi:hypothetical protein
MKIEIGQQQTAILPRCAERTQYIGNIGRGTHRVEDPCEQNKNSGH